MTHQSPDNHARQHCLCVGGSNCSDKDHFPDIRGTTQCSLSFAHKKYNHATFRSTFTTSYLQILQEVWWRHTSKKITGSRPLVPFCQPKPKRDPTGGLTRWDAIQTVACKLDLSACCLKDGSLGGIWERGASLLVANLTRNMLRSWWHD